GMRFHDPGYLRVLREACDAHGVLLVFDEIATGFGRTGTLFAAEHAGVSPDVLGVGKALPGGSRALAAAVCSCEGAAAAESGGGGGRGELPVLAPGPTFMGNPLACAVAGASLDVLLGSSAGERAAGEGAAGEGAAGQVAAAEGPPTYPHGWRAEVQRIE